MENIVVNEAICVKGCLKYCFIHKYKEESHYSREDNEKFV